MKSNTSFARLAFWFLAVFGSLAVIASAGAESFSYPDFSSTNGLVIIDDAALAGTSLRLTPAAQSQAGTVWYSNKVNCANGFSTSFHFRFTGQGAAPGYPIGADGIAFSVQNVSTAVDSFEYGPSLNSVAVSFNTFWNPGVEVSDNFVGVCKNGQWLLQHDLNPTPIRLKDGQAHLAEIVCDGANLTVKIDGTVVINSFPVPLANGLDADGNGWVGLGARTGVSFENHDILDWSFTPLAAAPPLLVGQPANQTVFTGGNAGFAVQASSSQPLSYQWFFNGTNINAATGSSLSLTSVQPAQAGNYFVVVSNAMGSVVSSNAQLMVLTPAAAGCFSYADFSSPGGLALVSNAATAGTHLRLTPSDRAQQGAAWYSGKQFCAGGFTTTFQFQISQLGGEFGYGADGFSFGIQNSGLDVEPIEYAAPHGLAVSFNTFFNPDEVSGNFVGIATNGVNWVMQRNLDGTGINLKDGNVHTVLVQYDGAALSVSIDGQTVIAAYPIALADAVDASGFSWVGFGARTGGAWEQHDILNWSFCGLTNTTLNHPPVATSQSVTLPENSSLPITLAASDADGDALTFNVTAPAHGSLSGSAPNLVYTPPANYVGPDQFTFTANDGKAASAQAVVGIQVTQIYQPPVARITVSPLANIPGLSGLVLIAVNNSNATAYFDGSQSSDIGNTPLTFAWSEGGSVFSTGALATNTLGAGSHTVTLVVNDGIGNATNSVALQVLPVSSLSCLNYPDFSVTNGLVIIGNAARAGTHLRLTPSARAQQGAAWYGAKQPCAGGFTSTFQFQISQLGGEFGNGADGFSFGIQNSGLDVEPIEYAATNGLAVSFNTFFNPGEVSGNFVGIATNGVNWVMQRNLDGTGINLKDGNVHTAVISYDGAALSVTIDGFSAITNYPVSLTNALDAGGNGWVGFAGRTGGAWEQHDILNWTFCSETNRPSGLVPVATIQLSPLATNLPLGGHLVISPNNSNATVVLDGSGSSDANHDPLQFTWTAGGLTVATTPVYSNLFGIGFSTVTLAVSNGTNTSSTSAGFLVMTPAQAVSTIMSVLEKPTPPGVPPPFPNTQPALSALSLARSFFVSSNLASGVVELSDFQSTVQGATTLDNATLAASLIAAAQDVIDAVNSGLPAPGVNSARASISVATIPDVQKAMHAKFSGAPGKLYNVEASTDLIHWQFIGNSIADQNGTIDFIDIYAGNYPARFYRCAAH